MRAKVPDLGEMPSDVMHCPRSAMRAKVQDLGEGSDNLGLVSCNDSGTCERWVVCC